MIRHLIQQAFNFALTSDQEFYQFYKAFGNSNIATKGHHLRDAYQFSNMRAVPESVLNQPFGVKTLYYMMEGDLIDHESLWKYLERVNIESNKNKIMQKFLAAEYYQKDIGASIPAASLSDVNEDDVYRLGISQMILEKYDLATEYLNI